MRETKEITAELSTLLPLLAEVGDLKRVRAANLEGSVAERAFRRSWTALLTGEDPGEIALRETATATAAARLGAIDGETLRRLGLNEREVIVALQKSFDEVAGPLPEDWRGHLRGALGNAGDDTSGGRASDGSVSNGEARTGTPSFVAMLERQPRAGATRPGRGRLVLEPPESHADHCWAVAVYGGLLCSTFEADAGGVFLAGLAHHLHNATLPDSGHAADVILSDHIESILARLQSEALDELSESLRNEISEALETVVGRVDSPEARAFQAADVLDRVLQMNQYANVAAFTLEQALDEMDLVHPGPEQKFHLEVLQAAGLR